MSETHTKKYIDLYDLGVFKEYMPEQEEVTFAEWQALPSSKLTDGKDYFITDLSVAGIEINDSTTGTDSVWSSSKTSQAISSASVTIDDTTPASNKVYSSQKTQNELNKKVGWSEAGRSVKKNLLTNNAISQTVNGITFTKNEDGSITANGTAIADVFEYIEDNNNYSDVILSGCPSGGALDKFCLQYSNFVDQSFNDYGSGVAIPSTKNTGTWSVCIYVKSGTTISNIVFKPMIRLSSIADDTYEPYILDNVELNEQKLSYADNAILGAKNLLHNTATNLTVNGITYTVNADGSVTANGTASDNSYFEISATSSNLPVGEYILSGGLSSNQFVYWNDYNGTTYVKNYIATQTEVKITHDKNGYDNVSIGIGINNGQTVSNLTFKPMLRLATDTDDTYVPYAMTNKELTPYAKSQSNPNLLDNPWFTVNQRGFSTQTSKVAYTVDRWKQNSAYGTVTLGSDGCISLNNTSGASNLTFIQYLPSELISSLVGKTVTLSVLLKDGTLLKNTATNLDFTQNAFYALIPYGTSSGISLRSPGNGTAWIQFAIVSGESLLNIKAVKLEIGTVSTLAMDTAPNYAEELLKCQRYFQKINKGTRLRISGYNANTFRATIRTVPMRTTPTLSNATLELRSLDESTTKTSTSQGAANGSEYILIYASYNAHGFTDGQIYVPTTSDLYLSADL